MFGFLPSYMVWTVLMRLQLQVGLLMYHVFLNSVFHCTWLLKMLVSVLTGGGVSASELHLDFQVLQKKKKTQIPFS